MRKALLILSFLVNFVIGGPSIDSLLIVIGKSTVAQQIEVLQAISECYLLQSEEKALFYAQEAYNRVRRTNNRSQEGEALVFWANTYEKIGDYTGSIAKNWEAAVLYDTLREERKKAYCYANIASSYTKLYDYSKALDFYYLALGICSGNSGYAKLSAVCLEAIGTINYLIGDFSNTIYYHKKALKIYNSENNQLGCANIYYSLGADYSALCSYDRAIDYYYKALNIYEDNSAQTGKAMVYHAIGLVYEDIGNLEKALKLNLKALDIISTIDDQQLKANFSKWIGYIYTQLRNYKKSLQYLNYAYKIEKQMKNTPEIIVTLEMLGMNKLFQGQYRAAKQYLNNALKLQAKIKDKWRISRISMVGSSLFSILLNREAAAASSSIKRTFIMVCL